MSTVTINWSAFGIIAGFIVLGFLVFAAIMLAILAHVRAAKAAKKATAAGAVPAAKPKASLLSTVEKDAAALMTSPVMVDAEQFASSLAKKILPGMAAGVATAAAIDGHPLIATAVSEAAKDLTAAQSAATAKVSAAVAAAAAAPVSK